MKYTLLLLFLFQWYIGNAQTWFIDSIFHQNQYRYYGAYFPASYNASSKMPVVFVLHGGGGTALGTVGFTQMDKVADTANFIVVFPQGGAKSGNGFSWAAGNGTVADSLGIQDVSFFSNLIDSLSSTFNIDTTRIFATGLSNGGFMCQRLACELSDKITAIASLAAYLNIDQMENCQPVRVPPVMMINGTDDWLIPYYGIPGYANSMDSLIRFWAKKNNCLMLPDSLDLTNLEASDNSTVTLFSFNQCNCNHQVLLYRVNGGGHTWPGVENVFYEIIAGETNEDIHASIEIWRFFSKHRIQCGLSYIPKDIPPNAIRVFPNPVISHLSWQLTSNYGAQSISILDMNGRSQLHWEVPFVPPSLAIERLKSGVYIIKITTLSGEVFTSKIIKIEGN